MNNDTYYEHGNDRIDVTIERIVDRGLRRRDTHSYDNSTNESSAIIPLRVSNIAISWCPPCKRYVSEAAWDAHRCFAAKSVLHFAARLSELRDDVSRTLSFETYSDIHISSATCTIPRIAVNCSIWGWTWLRSDT